MLLHLVNTWGIVALVVILIMVGVTIVIETAILIVEEENVRKIETPTVVTVAIGVTAAAQHHHVVEDVTRLTIGVAGAIQEVLPGVAVLCGEEVGIMMLRPPTTPRHQRQLILRLVGKVIIVRNVLIYFPVPTCDCHGRGQAVKRSKVKGEGQNSEQVTKRFLFSWPSFVAQVSSSNFSSLVHAS
jgi:hypothetical protein